MKALLHGTWPSKDHNGENLTGWRAAMGRSKQKLRTHAACIAKCGDWAWQKQILGMRAWRGEQVQKLICWLCNATLYDQDFSSEGVKSAINYGIRHFAASAFLQQQFVSAIWQIPGFTLAYIKPDWMHTCCLGILLAYEGNCMWELFVSLGGTFDKHLGPCSVLLHMIKVMATKELGLEQPFASLTIGMFRTKASKRPVMRLLKQLKPDTSSQCWCRCSRCSSLARQYMS